MITYRATVTDEAGAVVFKRNVQAVNLRLALERLARMLATADAGHGTSATALTFEVLGNYVSDPDTGARVFVTDTALLAALAIEPLPRRTAREHEIIRNGAAA